ncbi:MAG: DUF4026 domain-containing protein [Polyangiaceae bacterium]
MGLPPEFQGALDDPPSSELIAVLPPGSPTPSVSEALALLEESRVGVTRVAPIAPEHPRARWEVEIELELPGRAEPALAHAWLEPAPRELLVEGVPWRGVTPEDLDDGRSSSWAVGLRLALGEHALVDYHFQTRLLFALCPEPLLVLDVNAVTPRPGHWLREVAEAKVPPSPSTLFTIHDVGDDSKEGPHWLHTHGLDRCGRVELDALAIPGEVTGLVGQLMNSVAAMFLEQGIPAPDEPFSIGQDLELVWLPWAEGIRKAKNDGPGGKRDRDESHCGARAVLFVPKRGLLGKKYESLALLSPILEENPLLYVSAQETERMALLASERLPRFFSLFDRCLDGERWLFLVKLGYAVDGAENDRDREHLWFRVHGHRPGEVDATLLNAPYRVAQLKEGDRAHHPLELLTDWAILCEHGRFDADTVGELERALSHADQMH